MFNIGATEMSPLVCILLFGFLPVLLAGYKYWRRSHVKVNCWFCNLNTFIPIKCHDGWICSHCHQYNGFKPDGDYNREIPAQWDSTKNTGLSYCWQSKSSQKLPVNGLCQDCNRNQELKIAQLASFQPINPDNFDVEIENFSYHLERAYRLCPPCEFTLEETLARKKTLLLDMNLQITGKKIKTHSYFSMKELLKKSVVRLSALFTMGVVVSLTLFMVSTVSSDHVMTNFSDYVNRKSTSRVSFCHRDSLIRYFLPNVSCLKSDNIMSPLPPHGGLKMFFDFVGLYAVPLCLSGLALQVASSLHSGRKAGLLLWTAFASVVLLQHGQYQITDSIEGAQMIQIVLSFFILVFSWLEMNHKKMKPLSSAKKLSHGTFSSSNTNKWKMESSHQSNGVAAANRLEVSVPQKNFFQLRAQESHPSESKIIEGQPTTAPNYLTRKSSMSIMSLGTGNSSTVVDNSLCPSNLDVQSSASQDDNRSDASVDSAFSNPDSFTLDAADSLNSSVSAKIDSHDDDVQSLIEGLSIGSLTKHQSQKKYCQYKTRSYGSKLKKNSVLTPSKLTNIMNDSLRSGIWRNTKSKMQVVSSPGAAELNSSNLSRPSSPCGSIHNQSTFQCGKTFQSSSPPSSFRSEVPSWNSMPVSQNALTVCVPPNPLASNPCFGNIGPSFPNSTTISQVVYTPYGLYHQMVNPSMYMIPPQSPAFSNQTPLSSHGSQFSPRSFCSSSSKDVNSFESDTDHEVDFSPRSTKGRRSKISLSASFVESVWQSRYAIMYTTLCYVILGSMIGTFFYRGLLSNIFSKFMDRYQLR